ncbi:MAG: hypothetical protein HYS04_13085 [Acidobacteria bacterium]|nr:hypothetical protein [Acidobacteriota bacterium]
MRIVGLVWSKTRRSKVRSVAVVSIALHVALASAQDPPTQMKTYQMVFLRNGPNHAVRTLDAAKIQQAHLEHLAKLNRERINLLYGPFLDHADLRGIAVLDVESPEAATKLFADDPHVKTGNLVIEVKPWLGPKGWFNPPDDPPVPENLVLGFLMRGRGPSVSASEATEIQKGHLAYLDDLHKQNKLLVAGPFGEDSDWRGLVIYRVGSVDEAKQLTAGDPAVKADRLFIDARLWMTFKGILK